MMDTTQYLHRFQSQLKGLSTEEQGLLIQEIAAHIEDYENDAALEKESVKDDKRLVRELGSPEELGNGMQEVHQPGNLWDIFLVIVPTFFFLPRFTAYLDWITTGGSISVLNWTEYGSLWWAAIRIILLLTIGITWLASLKGTKGSYIYWQIQSLLMVTGIVISGRTWPWYASDAEIYNTVGIPELIFWFLVIGFQIIWLVRTLWQVRSNQMYLAMAFTLILNAIFNHMLYGGTIHFDLEVLSTRYSIGGYIGYPEFALFVWPVLFFLFRQRDIRWLGLLAMPLAIFADTAWLYWEGIPVVVVEYFVPLVIILLFWARDVSKRSFFANSYLLKKS